MARSYRSMRHACSTQASLLHVNRHSLKHISPAGGGRHRSQTQCPRLIGSCLDLASPTRGRICGSLYLQLGCRSTLPLAGKHGRLNTPHGSILTHFQEIAHLQCFDGGAEDIGAGSAGHERLAGGFKGRQQCGVLILLRLAGVHQVCAPDVGAELEVPGACMPATPLKL